MTTHAADEKLAESYIARARRCELLIDLRTLEREAEPDVREMRPEIATGVETALAEAKKRLTKSARDESDRRLLAKAEEATARQADGAWLVEELLANLMELIPLDDESKRRREAKRILDMASIRSRRCPFPGVSQHLFEFCQWRLVRPLDESRVEFWQAATDAGFADMLDADPELLAPVMSALVEETRVECDLFCAWADKETARGRPESELIFGNFARETGYRSMLG